MQNKITHLLFAWLLLVVTLCAQIPTTGYNHVSLQVADIAKSADFYGKVVGLEAKTN
jgi:hypothetical protein